MPQDLLDHNCLVHKVGTPHDTWSFKGPQARFSVRVSGDPEANVGEPLHLAAIGGRGLVQLATYVVGPDIVTGSLVTALDAHEPDAILIPAL